MTFTDKSFEEWWVTWEPTWPCFGKTPHDRRVASAAWQAAIHAVIDEETEDE